MNRLYGNAIVGQSGGPSSAINATLAGVIRGACADMGVHIKKLYGMRHGIVGLMRGDVINLTDIFFKNGIIDLEGLESLSLTPAAALGSCRKKLPAPGDEDEELVMDAIFRQLSELDIKYFFYIGGNDSMDTVAKLSEYARKKDIAINFVGVPKTIDNDLVGMDHTPGYGSAAKYIATTVGEIIRDTAVYVDSAVTIVEIMGRDAGWLTAASALGRIVTGQAPDFVYLPERSFDMQRFFADIEIALATHPNVVIAVSEGLQFADGRYVGEATQSNAVDVFGHKYLAGTAKALEIAVREKFGCKVRSVELSLPQRCAAHLLSAQDIEEALATGAHSVRAAIEGATGIIMTIHRITDSTSGYAYDIGYEDIGIIANRTKHVSDSFINTEGNNVTDECLNYILPLIRGERFPRYVGGLPTQFIF
ncbi:MAG: 6-phosphofructokinase [Ruminococcaceae bacterium]|nr:6-phosphofructokinase [Oscillospiraceae bacterium]